MIFFWSCGPMPCMMRQRCWVCESPAAADASALSPRHASLSDMSAQGNQAMQVLVDDVFFYSCVYDVHFCRQHISSQLIGLLLATRGRSRNQRRARGGLGGGGEGGAAARRTSRTWICAPAVLNRFQILNTPKRLLRKVPPEIVLKS